MLIKTNITIVSWYDSNSIKKCHGMTLSMRFVMELPSRYEQIWTQNGLLAMYSDILAPIDVTLNTHIRLYKKNYSFLITELWKKYPSGTFLFFIFYPKYYYIPNLPGDRCANYTSLRMFHRVSFYVAQV